MRAGTPSMSAVDGTSAEAARTPTWRSGPSPNGALNISDAAHPILRGEAPVTLREDSIKRAKPAFVPKMQVTEEDAPLFSALKAKRRALAEAARVPAYVIFPDRTLQEMAERRPQTLDEMARIGGVGAKKLDSYGDAFLSVIAGDTAPMHPARRALAGRDAGTLFDRLAETQMRLARGEDGTEKPLSCSTGQLKRIAESRPANREAMGRIIDEARLDRFAQAFLTEITSA